MSWFRRLNLIAVIWCFVVVVFGAYVRLSNAGLGCPDWPGCYGQVAVPEAPHEVTQAEQAFPQRPVEAPKAWKEMIHRYLVGGLSLLILAMLAMGIADRGRTLPLPMTLAVVAVILVQIVFGALTVTLKVHPLVVTTHLLLGLTTLSLLWLQLLMVWRSPTIEVPLSPKVVPITRRTERRPAGVKPLAAFALVILSAQIFLGGWTSTNYAAPSCPDFPTCQGRWWPQTDFAQAFKLSRGFDINYEYGVLDNIGRLTIHLVHRCGAALVGLLLSAIAVYLLRSSSLRWRRFGVGLLAAVLLQITLGISLVLSHFRLWLGDAHNAGAAILLLTVVALNFFAWQDRS